MTLHASSEYKPRAHPPNKTRHKCHKTHLATSSPSEGPPPSLFAGSLVNMLRQENHVRVALGWLRWVFRICCTLHFETLQTTLRLWRKWCFFFLLTIRSQRSGRNPYGIPTDPWQLNSLLPSSTKNLPAMGATSLHPVVNMVSTSWGSPAIAVARAAGHPAVHGWCPESIADSDVESVEHPGHIEPSISIRKTKETMIID